MLNEEINEVEVLILGAGVCGLAAAIGCQRAGIDDYVVLERAGDVGGTWHHNVYPGCGVDIPSHVYSFSYAPYAEWSRVFAPQAEVKDYLKHVVSTFDLMAKIRLGVELIDATWLEEDQVWHVVTRDGSYRAGAFVVGAGPLHEPIIPRLPGAEDFVGESFHSSRWPAHLDLTGKRVVVPGTGASALQFVPKIQPEVESLTVLQRTPSWVMPTMDWNTSRLERGILRRSKLAARLMRLGMWAPLDLFFAIATRHPRVARSMGAIGKWHMGRSIKDPQLREDLTPTYAPTCRRLGLSNDFYKSLAQDNVSLVTSPAAELRSNSVVTTSGEEYAADVVIYGTGFQTIQHHPVNSRIRGRDGRTLEEVWAAARRPTSARRLRGSPTPSPCSAPTSAPCRAS